jgi:UDP-glucose 4-epimerase
MKEVIQISKKDTAMLRGYNRILVTGGAGFMGRHLVDALLSLGKEVVVFDNLSAEMNGNISVGAKLTKGDVRNLRQVIQTTKGVDLIFHLAANANGTVSVNDPRFDFETNAVGTFNVLDAALHARVKRLVYVSSASVYGRPQYFPIDEKHPTKPFIPYGASKLVGEIYCNSFFKTYNLPAVIARPFCVYGPGENPKLALVEVSRYLRWHLNKKPIRIVGDLDRKTRDFVHVNDLLEGLLLIADKAPAGEAFNVGSGKEVSMRELTTIISSVTGRSALLDVVTAIKEDTYRLVGDISKIEALGYAPKISLVEGVKQLVKDLGENPERPMGAAVFKKGQKGEIQSSVGL